MTLRPSRLLSLIFILFFLAPAALTARSQSGQANFAGFDAHVEQVMKDWKVPGLAVAIVKDGAVVYAKGYGFRDVKNKLNVTPDTLFAIGSCSKAFTAAAMGVLVDEGKLDWDKPVRQYLSTFRLHDEYAAQHLRAKDLVTHQSGLPRHDLVWYGAPLSRQELFDRLRHLEPSKPLHARFQYNNLMYMAAGVLVGELGGGSWEDFVRRKILDPLEMKNSNFSVAVSQKAADFALPYREVKDEAQEIPFRNIDAIGPAGSINSSVNEMANWIMLQLNKGKFKGKQVISEASLRETQTPQIVTGGELRYDEDFYASYAMGWGVTSYRGRLLLAHSGGIDGFVSRVALLPRDRIGVVVLTNSGSPASGIVANNVLDRTLGLSEIAWNQRAKDDQAKAKEAQAKAKANADKTRKTGTQPSHTLKDFTGRFEHPAYGALTVTQEGEQLKFDLHGLTAALQHYHYDIFQLADGPPGFEGMKVAFMMNKAGDIDRVAVPLEASVKDIIFTRMAEEADKTALERLTGEYDLAGATVKVTLRGEKTLIASVPGQPDYELVPSKGTLFNLKGLEGYSVEFKLDAAGKVAEAFITQPNGTFTLKKK